MLGGGEGKRRGEEVKGGWLDWDDGCWEQEAEEGGRREKAEFGGANQIRSKGNVQNRKLFSIFSSSSRLLRAAITKALIV